MNTKVNIVYPVQGTALFSNSLTIHYNLNNYTDPNIFGIRFVIDGETEYTDTDLLKSFTVTGLSEDSHILSGYLLDKKQKKIHGTDFTVKFNSYNSTLSVENKLTYVLKSTIPNFVKEDYDNFVIFLKAYYEWLYSSNNPFYAPLISEDFKDIDRTPEYFVKYFRQQFLVDFPESLTLDKQTGTPLNIKTLIKNIVDFYSSKGTEKSIKFLLKILYDTYSEIYYPKKDIFKSSYSRWNQNNSIKFAFSSNRIYEIKTKRMYQDSGETVTSIANINEIQIYRSLDNKQIVEVFYSNVEGEFDFTKQFKINLDDEIVYLTPTLIVNLINIEDGGLNYKINDKLSIKRLTNTTGKIEDIAYARVAEVDTYGTIVKTEFVNFGVSYIPKSIDSNGNIVEQNIFSYYVIPDSENGTDASFSVETGYIANYSGFWTDKNSHTNSIKRIADNKRYQEFSYVVRTDRSLDRYVEVLKKLAHPAGIELLGDIVITKTLVEPTIITDAFLDVYTPLIGNYAAYRLETEIDMRNGAFDFYPNGFDPTTFNPLQDGSDEVAHQVSTNGRLDELVDQTRFKFVPDVSDSENINNYWVVYPHPNTEINNYTDSNSFLNIKLIDFLKQER
jgi:hypothetical protein